MYPKPSKQRKNLPRVKNWCIRSLLGRTATSKPYFSVRPSSIPYTSLTLDVANPKGNSLVEGYLKPYFLSDWRSLLFESQPDWCARCKKSINLSRSFREFQKSSSSLDGKEFTTERYCLLLCKSQFLFLWRRLIPSHIIYGVSVRVTLRVVVPSGFLVQASFSSSLIGTRAKARQCLS